MLELILAFNMYTESPKEEDIYIPEIDPPREFYPDAPKDDYYFNMGEGFYIGESETIYCEDGFCWR